MIINLKNLFFVVAGIASTAWIRPICYPIVGSQKDISPTKLDRVQKWRNSVSELKKEHPQDIIINGNPKIKSVALTFDDGPDAEITPAVLDILKKHKIVATFFFLGEHLEKHKDIVKRAHKEGHAVASHTWSHPNLIKATKEEIEKELTSTQEKIIELIGLIPSLFRPPYGNINTSVIETYKKLGYKACLWSLDTCDWEKISADSITEIVIDNVRPGEIILMHSNKGKKYTVEALSQIITELKNLDYSFVRVDDPRFLSTNSN